MTYHVCHRSGCRAHGTHPCHDFRCGGNGTAHGGPRRNPGRPLRAHFDPQRGLVWLGLNGSPGARSLDARVDSAPVQPGITRCDPEPLIPNTGDGGCDGAQSQTIVLSGLAAQKPRLAQLGN